MRNKTPKRQVKAKLRDDRRPATAPNETWAMDFVHDQLATGKKIRMLTVVDTFSRFSPVVDPRFSYRAEDVVGALERAYYAPDGLSKFDVMVQQHLLNVAYQNEGAMVYEVVQ